MLLRLGLALLLSLSLAVLLAWGWDRSDTTPDVDRAALTLAAPDLIPAR